ncbi:MAG: response regulator, partial [Candidatus Methylomirabilis sp.]|nr:response regulator [Deltaproteobacteria bacterium]
MDGLADLRAFPLLLVDDEEDNLTIFRLNFKNLFTIHTASSGEEALKILAEREIAILIVDQRMPNMTGVELLNIASERWPQTIRVLMTAYADIDVVIEA